MRRQHLTTAITLLLLIGILVLGLAVGYKSLVEPIPSGSASSGATPNCTSEQLRRIHSRQVQVSVFNAGDRAGLAGVTLSALARRGFARGDVGNAPDGARVRRVQIWTTTRRDAAAQLVARQFGRATVIRIKKPDLGPGVDVVVGNRLHHMARAPQSIRVRKPQAICVPTGASASAG